MHQRDLGLVALFTPLAALTTTTQGPGVDVGATYGNVGRREFQVLISLSGSVLNGSPTLDGEIQDNTTSGATGFTALQTITQMTTAGNQQVFVKTAKRYLRIIYTMGATTSMGVNAFVLLEKRAP